MQYKLLEMVLQTCPTSAFVEKNRLYEKKLSCVRNYVILLIVFRTLLLFRKGGPLMNKEDLILQKLDSMDIELKSVRSEIKDVRSEIKDVRSEIKDVHSELKELREDATEVKVNQAKHAGKLETLETKLDAFIVFRCQNP